MDRIKIGLVSNEFFDQRLGGMGGFGQAARRIAETFNRDPSLGVDVVYLTGVHRASPTEREKSVHDTRMMLSRPRSSSYYRDLRRERIDLLMTIDYRANYRKIFRALPRTPVLVWVRDPRTPEDVAHVQTLRMPNGDGAVPQGIEPIDCTSLRGVLRTSRWLGRRVVLATAAPYLAANIPATYGVRDVDSVFLPTIVEIDTRGIPKSPRPTVVYLGRLDPIKRPWLFVELARHFPEAEFLVMGQSNFHGPGSWEPEDVPPNVRMLGHLDDIERNRHLAAAWVLVNTSVHESLSSSFLEALACEAPLVSCLDPGEVVSRFGRFAGRWDGDGMAGVPKLAEALRELLENDDLRARLGREGREWVRQTYSRAGFLEVFTDLCHRLGVRD